MPGIAQTSFKMDAAALLKSIETYAELTGKEPGPALQRHGKNLQLYSAQELRKERPSKQDISFEALVARRRKRKRSKSQRGEAYEFNKADLGQGKLLGLKIRPSVVAEAQVKFGQASALRKPKAAYGPALPYNRRKGKKSVSQKKTRRYQGKDVSVTAFMIAREIAVRRSGIGYLSYGLSVSGFKKSGEAVTRKVTHRDRYRRFAAKIELIVQPKAAQFRMLGVVPGTKKVGEKRGVFRRGVQRTRADIKTHLVGRAKANKRRAFSGRGPRRR